MFSFGRNKINLERKNLKFILNNQVIYCSKSTAVRISPIIKKHFSESNQDYFSITIPEFTDSLLCSEEDYKYFDDILNLIEIQITITNKDILKIFARELEINELTCLIEMFEQSYEIITTDKFLLIQKEIFEKILNINNDNYGQLIDYLLKIKDKEEEKILISKESLYNFVLIACMTNASKIEILLNFLKDFESITKSGQFKYFKEEILKELKDNQNSKEIRFIVRYLFFQKEIPKEKIESTFSDQEINSYVDLIFIFSTNDRGQIISEIETQKRDNSNFLNEFEVEDKYQFKIYQSIQNDDLESFTQLINRKTGKINYNDYVEYSKFNRNSEFFQFNYLNLSSFFGSEKVFNLIYVNTNPKYEITYETFKVAVIGGNSSIIHKCEENIDFNDMYNPTCLYVLKAIQYHRNEVFEWLIEKLNDKTQLNHVRFIECAIRYNNIEALFILLSMGISYQSLFAFSMLYNNFYLAKLALKLPYKSKFCSRKIKINDYSPFTFMIRDEMPVYIAISKNQIDFVKIIVNDKNYDPFVKYQNMTPIEFAIANDKFEIVKFLLTKRNIMKAQKYKMSLFEFTILQKKFNIAEFFLHQPTLKSIGDYTYSSFKLPDLDNINNISNPDFEFISNCTHFFLDTSKSEKTEEIKNKICLKNQSLLACLAAYSLNEVEFVPFLNKYKIDINITDSETVYFKIFK